MQHRILLLPLIFHVKFGYVTLKYQFWGPEICGDKLTTFWAEVAAACRTNRTEPKLWHRAHSCRVHCCWHEVSRVARGFLWLIHMQCILEGTKFAFFQLFGGIWIWLSITSLTSIGRGKFLCSVYLEGRDPPSNEWNMHDSRDASSVWSVESKKQTWQFRSLRCPCVVVLHLKYFSGGKSTEACCWVDC